MIAANASWCACGMHVATGSMPLIELDEYPTTSRNGVMESQPFLALSSVFRFESRLNVR